MENNCVIRGNGMVVNGTYNIIKISGLASFGSNVISKKIIVNGNAYMGENVEADIIEINGTCISTGNIKCKRIYINGELNINGLRLESGLLKVNGSIKALKCEITADEIIVNGEMLAKHVKGNLIKILERKRKLFIKLFSKKEFSKIEFIDAKNIEINNISVKQIKCQDIRVGKNSYINELNCFGLARINSETKIDRLIGKYVKE